MNIQTSLMAWYDFEEDYSAGHEIYDSSGRGNHVKTRGTFIEPVNNYTFYPSNATRVVGKNGYAIHPYFGCYHKDREDALGVVTYPDFRLASDSFTIAAWQKIDSKFTAATSYVIAIKFEEYILRARLGSGLCTFRRYHTDMLFESISSDAGSVIVPNEWFFIIGWYDKSAGTINIQINDGVISSTAATAATRVSEWPFTIGFDLVSGFAPHPSYANSVATGTDWMGIWKRALPQAERIWLYNSGAGRGWADVVPDAETECKTIACCESVSTYVSSSASDSEAGSINEGECNELVEISFHPPCGVKVVYPIYVKLTSNYETAVIRYTTDGTDPTEESAVYMSPILVESAATQIKAKAWPDVCDAGDVYECQWQSFEDLVLFKVYCTPYTDTVGRWGEWAPNGVDDLYWWLDMTLAANTDFARFEIYQLDDMLEWSTGAAWATDNPITPPPPWDQGTPFSVFPLQFNEIGTGILNTDYAAAFGTIIVGNHQYVISGEPIVDPAGIYEMIMYLDSGEVVYAFSAYADCDPCAAPPCGTEPGSCPSPAIVSIAPGCESVIVSFTVTAPNRNWRIYCKENTPGSVYVVSASGSGSGALASPIIGLASGKEYLFYVSQELTEAGYSHCSAWMDSMPQIGYAIDDETVEISASSILVDSGDPVTVTVNSYDVPVGGTVTVTSNPVLIGSPWSVTPNAVGQTRVFTVTADTVFTATVASGCANPTATVTVNTTVLASCDSAWVAAHQLLLVYRDDGRTADQMWVPCSVQGDPANTCNPKQYTAPHVMDWDGHLVGLGYGSCTYDSSFQGEDIYQFAVNEFQVGIELQLVEASVWGGAPGVYWWVLTVKCPTWANPLAYKHVWVGYKTDGSNPEGYYARLASATMCDTDTTYVRVMADIL